jgi:hypothetical protein
MNFKNWLEDKERPPRVLWITGMNSSGSKPKKLAMMGYDVKSVGTTTNYFVAYLGRFKRYHPFTLLKSTADKWGVQHVKKNLDKHHEEAKNFTPDVIIGTSQGGAIAMRLGIRFPKAKFVLGAPAWKIFNAKPGDLPRDTIIIHGKKDIIVPLEDSTELADKYGYKLRVYNFGHYDVPFGVLKSAIDEQLLKLGMAPPKSLPPVYKTKRRRNGSMKNFYEFLCMMCEDKLKNEIKSLGLEKTPEDAGRSTHSIGKYVKDGQGYFVKYPNPQLQSVVEHLAYKIYKLFGIKVPESYLVVDENNERLGIATKGVPGKLALSHKNLVGHKDMNDGFYVDAFLANWDVMGLNFDNIIVSNDAAYRIDPGGSLTFRAQGGRKENRFSHEPGEVNTFKSPQMSPQASSVFSHMTDEDNKRAAKIFTNVSWNDIENQIDQVAVESKEKAKELQDSGSLSSEIDQDTQEIKQKLKSRYDKIISQINSSN